jgi:hypothetical protein
MKRFISVLAFAFIMLLPAPAKRSAQAATTTHSVTLTWTASTTTGATYNVYKIVGPCGAMTGFAVLNTVPITALVYTDSGVTAGVTYCYTVTAVTSGGQSAVGAGGAIQVVVPLSIAATVPAPPANTIGTSQ